MRLRKQFRGCSTPSGAMNAASSSIRLELGGHTRTDVQRPGERHSAPAGGAMLPNHLGSLEEGRPTLLVRQRCAAAIGSLPGKAQKSRRCVELQLSRFPRCNMGGGKCPGCFGCDSGPGGHPPTKIFARDESDDPWPVVAGRLHAQQIVLK